jgi:AraC-like DNA-binding protein
MNLFYEIVLLSTATLGLVSTVSLLVRARSSLLLSVLFIVFTFSISGFSFLVFCNIRGVIPDTVFLIRTLFPLYYFVPPAIYLYMKYYLYDQPRLNKKDLLHFVPISLHVLYTIPLYIEIARNPGFFSTMLKESELGSTFYNGGFLPDYIHELFRVALSTFYIYLGTQLFFSRKLREFTRLNKDIFPASISWIKVFIVTVILFSVFATIIKVQIFFFEGKLLLTQSGLLVFGMLFWYDLLILYALINPIVLFGLPHFQKIMEVKPFGNSPIELQKQGEQELDESEMAKARILVTLMNDYISEHQPFRNPGFNLTELSKSIKVPEYHLYYIFRHIIKKSFVEFRNELRVAHVIQNLKKDMSDIITIEAIGADAGFNSRATFFTAFKRYTGMTPTQYLNSHPDAATGKA